MPDISGSYIDGVWREPAAGQTFAVVDPADGTTIADFGIASRDDCHAAIEAAAAAGPTWAATPPRERSETLRRAFEILRAERRVLAETIVRENGKALSDALAEADYATEFFRWFAEEAVRIPGDYRVSPNGDKRIVVTREPIGVSLLITPWNFPAAMATRKLAPVLAAGCTTILKPARETPLTAVYVVEALHRAGVPKGVVNLVVPSPTGPAVAEMLHHPAVTKLSFTGSTQVGRLLLREAADTIVSSSMELGGNAPFIVLEDADIDEALEGAIVAKMRNGGSACTAANRFYVHRSRYREFSEGLASAMADFEPRPGLDPDCRLGALVSTAERDKIGELVSGAVEEGAHVTLGGTPMHPGAFYAPTVLTDVEHGSTITRTEIFGPVAPLVPFADIETAIAMANDTEYGLIAYVYGSEGDAMRVAHRIDAGMVAVNRGVLSDPAAPFGGMKQSGLGREGAAGGILEFLEEKYIGLAP